MIMNSIPVGNVNADCVFITFTISNHVLSRSISVFAAARAGIAVILSPSRRWVAVLFSLAMSHLHFSSAACAQLLPVYLTLPNLIGTRCQVIAT
jgi:hypothetical protein